MKSLALVPLLVGLAVATDSPAQQKKPQGNNQKQAKDKAAKDQDAKNKAAVAGMKLQEGEALRNAYLLVLGTNHDYKGHRGKALTEVKEALKLLNAQVMKTGTPQQKDALKKENATVAAAEKAANGATMLHEPQPTSDAQLGQAKRLLIQVGAALAANKQPNVHKHVQQAIAEINAALKVSAAAKTGLQFAEAELLRNAYLLLLAGDADYDGHRAAAMRAVKAAFDGLDAQVAANGTAEQKAAIAKENAAITAAEQARKTGGAIQETQLKSDAYLAEAKEKLAKLDPLLAKNKQFKLGTHIETAIKEIDIALKIN